MTRRAVPYIVGEEPAQYAGTPMACPTREFANHLTGNVMQGIDTRGSLALVMPLQTPHDVGMVQGTTVGVPASRGTRGDPLIRSNTVTGGVVNGYITSPDSIRTTHIVARNNYSPQSHSSDQDRAAYSAKTPPAAVKPSKDNGPIPSYSRRGTGGNYTIPNPLSPPGWPTSSDMLAANMRARQF